MHRRFTDAAKSFLSELLVYGALVAAYCLLVLRYLAGWLDGLFQHERQTYAIVSLALITVQAFVLHQLTAFLLQRFRRGRKQVR